MHRYRVFFTMPNDEGKPFDVHIDVSADTGEEAAFEVGKLFAHPDSEITEVIVLS